MKKAIVVLFAFGLVSITGLFWTQSPRAADDQPDDVKTFMQAKLEHSKNILEGLATENYDIVARDSQQLTLLSLDADWKVIQTAEYGRQSLAFRKTSQSLTDAAQKKNLDGATLAFVELTLKCVQCHKYVRSIEMASLDGRENPLQPDGNSTASLRLPAR